MKILNTNNHVASCVNIKSWTDSIRRQEWVRKWTRPGLEREPTNWMKMWTAENKFTINAETLCSAEFSLSTKSVDRSYIPRPIPD